MENFKITIRPAKEEDSRRIWEIRNSPLVRANSNNPEEIAFDGHNRWFLEKYFYGKNNRCLVAESAGLVIGYCRLDEADLGPFLISIAVDPAYHGRGAGGRLLFEAKKSGPAGQELMAEIKKTNQASQNLFLKNHFKIISEEGDNLLLKLNQ